MGTNSRVQIKRIVNTTELTMESESQFSLLLAHFFYLHTFGFAKLNISIA